MSSLQSQLAYPRGEPKDYIRNKRNSIELARSIQDYHVSRGDKEIKVWVEEDVRFSPQGNRLPTNYYIRSNIKYSVKGIQ